MALQDTDNLIVQRGSDLHSVEIQNMSTIQDTDLLVIGRGSNSYKITGLDFNNSVGGPTGTVDTPSIIAPADRAGEMISVTTDELTNVQDNTSVVSGNSATTNNPGESNAGDMFGSVETATYIRPDGLNWYDITGPDEWLTVQAGDVIGVRGSANRSEGNNYAYLRVGGTIVEITDSMEAATWNLVDQYKDYTVASPVSGKIDRAWIVGSGDNPSGDDASISRIIVKGQYVINGTQLGNVVLSFASDSGLTDFKNGDLVQQDSSYTPETSAITGVNVNANPFRIGANTQSSWDTATNEQVSSGDSYQYTDNLRIDTGSLGSSYELTLTHDGTNSFYFYSSDDPAGTLSITTPTGNNPVVLRSADNGGNSLAGLGRYIGVYGGGTAAGSFTLTGTFNSGGTTLTLTDDTDLTFFNEGDQVYGAVSGPNPVIFESNPGGTNPGDLDPNSATYAGLAYDGSTTTWGLTAQARLLTPINYQSQVETYAQGNHVGCRLNAGRPDEISFTFPGPSDKTWFTVASGSGTIYSFNVPLDASATSWGAWRVDGTIITATPIVPSTVIAVGPGNTITVDGGTWDVGDTVKGPEITPATGTVDFVGPGATMALSTSDESGTKQWVVNRGKFVKGEETLSQDAAPDITPQVEVIPESDAIVGVDTPLIPTSYEGRGQASGEILTWDFSGATPVPGTPLKSWADLSATNYTGTVGTAPPNAGNSAAAYDVHFYELNVPGTVAFVRFPSRIDDSMFVIFYSDDGITWTYDEVGTLNSANVNALVQYPDKSVTGGRAAKYWAISRVTTTDFTGKSSTANITATVAYNYGIGDGVSITTLTLSGNKDLTLFEAGDAVQQDSGYTPQTSAITGFTVNPPSDNVGNLTAQGTTMDPSRDATKAFDKDDSTFAYAVPNSGSGYLQFAPNPPIQMNGRTFSFKGGNGGSSADFTVYINDTDVTSQLTPAEGSWQWYELPVNSGVLNKFEIQGSTTTVGGYGAALHGMKLDNEYIEATGTGSVELTLTDDTDLANFRVGDSITQPDASAPATSMVASGDWHSPEYMFQDNDEPSFVYITGDPGGPYTATLTSNFASGIPVLAGQDLVVKYTMRNVTGEGDASTLYIKVNGDNQNLPTTESTSVLSFTISGPFDLKTIEVGGFNANCYAGIRNMKVNGVLITEASPEIHRITAIGPGNTLTFDGGTFNVGDTVTGPDTTPATGTIGSIDPASNTMTLSVSDEAFPKRWIVNQGKFVKGPTKLTTVALKLYGSVFASTPIGALNHVASDWQITNKSDTTYSNPVDQTFANSVNLTEWAPVGLQADTAYRCRVKYHSVGLASDWSKDITFKTAVATKAAGGVTYYDANKRSPRTSNEIQDNYGINPDKEQNLAVQIGVHPIIPCPDGYSPVAYEDEGYYYRAIPHEFSDEERQDIYKIKSFGTTLKDVSDSFELALLRAKNQP